MEGKVMQRKQSQDKALNREMKSKNFNWMMRSQKQWIVCTMKVIRNRKLTHPQVNQRELLLTRKLDQSSSTFPIKVMKEATVAKGNSQVAIKRAEKVKSFTNAQFFMRDSWNIAKEKIENWEDRFEYYSQEEESDKQGEELKSLKAVLSYFFSSAIDNPYLLVKKDKRIVLEIYSAEEITFKIVKRFFKLFLKT